MYFKFYQYINGEWISHYKSEIEIQQYTKPIEISILGTCESRVILGMTNKNFVGTYHHIDIEKNKKTYDFKRLASLFSRLVFCFYRPLIRLP